MNLVLTIAVGPEYEKMAKLTHPSIQAYAKKIGAEFLCIKEKKLAKSTPHWDKFQINELLLKYERILYVDTDLIIREDCPNLFDIVPKTLLGAFNEAPFTDRSKELLIDCCKQYNITLPNWNGKYYNTGVLVISQIHRSLFEKPEKEYFSFYEQSYLNMMISFKDIKVFDIDHKFNRMTCMDQLTGEERFDSYIIHYAGYPNLDYVMNVISHDLKKWMIDNISGYKYIKHLYVSVNGGLGDQICAGPALEYLIKMYSKDEVVIATHWPRIFKHLAKENVSVVHHGMANLKNDTPYWIRNSLPGPETVNWSIVSHLLCHTVDYCSMALLKRTLPLKERRIKFHVKSEDYENLFELIGRKDLESFLIIHPGKHWESKTFPVQYWQNIINAVVKKRRDVVIIGKTELGDPPDYIAGARGTVDVDPNGAIDLRDKLNLGELGALLSMARILISNDSAPVHLAGAFDNWIYLIPSCKHPDHVLPYRNGSPWYKSRSFYNRLFLDDIESRPTQVYPTSADVKDVCWDEYLCDYHDVIRDL